MPDREKVIADIEEQIAWIRDNDFHKFPGWGHAVLAMKDAIALLKNQEAVEPKTGHWIKSKCLDECFWVCSNCNFPSEAIAAPKLYKYCPNCGAKIESR